MKLYSLTQLGSVPVGETVPTHKGVKNVYDSKGKKYHYCSGTYLNSFAKFVCKQIVNYLGNEVANF